MTSTMLEVHGGPCDGQQVHTYARKGWAPGELFIHTRQPADRVDPLPPHRYVLDGGVYRYAPAVQEAA